MPVPSHTVYPTRKPARVETFSECPGERIRVADLLSSRGLKTDEVHPDSVVVFSNERMMHTGEQRGDGVRVYQVSVPVVKEILADAFSTDRLQDYAVELLAKCWFDPSVREAVLHYRGVHGEWYFRGEPISQAEDARAAKVYEELTGEPYRYDIDEAGLTP